jgi:hypothetical protein
MALGDFDTIHERTVARAEITNHQDITERINLTMNPANEVVSQLDRGL